MNSNDLKRNIDTCNKGVLLYAHVLFIEYVPQALV